MGGIPMHYLLFQNNGTQSIMKFDIISDGSEVLISIILIRIKSYRFYY